MKVIIGILAAVALSACSIENPKDQATGTSSTTSSAPAAAPGESPAPASKGKASDDSTQGGYLSGYVVSAFDLRVNGKSYADSEDFYTQEMASLTQQVASAGYAGYKMTFDGQLGLDDLKYGMNVYVAAEGNTGYAGDTKVDSNGRFMLGIPDGSGDETFRIRANKRVSVILTSPDHAKTVTWCYNFSSVDTEGSLADPVLISDFNTTLTKYQCADDEAGMTIPQNPNAPATTTGTATSTGTGTDVQ